MSIAKFKELTANGFSDQFPLGSQCADADNILDVTFNQSGAAPESWAAAVVKVERHTESAKHLHSSYSDRAYIIKFVLCSRL